MGEPKYDEDAVNLGYLRKQLINIQENKANKEDIPTATSQLINDNNFVNENQLNTALRYRGEATSDLNNATTFGMYNLKTRYTNAPITGNIYGILLVYPNKGGTHTFGDDSKWVVQEIRTSTDIYIRYGRSSGWLNWEGIANKEDIPTAISDLINDSNFINETQLNTEINKVDILNVHGENIPENSDLDNYTTAGVYYSINTITSATLSNSPIYDSGFKLIVEYLASTSRIIQTVRANNGSTSAIWVRTNTGSWGPWKKISMGNRVELYSGDLLSGSTTLSDHNHIINYDEVEIRYRVQDNIHSERIKVSEITSRTNIVLSGLNNTGNYLQPYALKLGFTIGLLTTTITHNGCTALNIHTSTFAITAATLNCRIMQVIGYKY